MEDWHVTQHEHEHVEDHDQVDAEQEHDHDEHDHDEHDHDEHDHSGHHHGHEPILLEPAQHRAEAVALFNGVWEMLETPDRTAEQDDQMVHAAHASRWHWSQVGDLGGAQQLAVGEWQCSRVYSVLGRGEPALHHARACLTICEASGLDDWVLAAAYESLARASATAGDHDGARAWMGKARAALSTIVDPEDRGVIEADLASLAELPGLADQ